MLYCCCAYRKRENNNNNKYPDGANFMCCVEVTCALWLKHYPPLCILYSMNRHLFLEYVLCIGWFNLFVFKMSIYRMLGGVAGRHMSTRRRGSSPMVRIGNNLTLSLEDGSSGPPRIPPRRRRAVTTSDHKSCALIQTRLKLGDIM